MLARMFGKRSPYSLWVKENGRKDIMGTNVEVYPKIKNRTTIEPSYITSRCIPKDSVSCHRQICTPVFTGELFRMSGKWNHRTCPRSYEWMRKLLYMYTVKFDSAVKQWSYKVLSGKY